MRIGNAVHPYVNDDKLDAMQDLVEGMLAGKIDKKHKLIEHLTTGDDSIFALAALTNYQVIDQYEDPAKERTWAEIADTDTVTDFETPKLLLLGDLETTGNKRPAKGNSSANPASRSRGHPVPALLVQDRAACFG